MNNEETNPLEDILINDYVSRKDVINQIFFSSDNTGDVVLSTKLMDRIKRIQGIQPKLKGEWIWDGNKYICSECGHFPWRITTEEHDEAFEDLTRTNAYKYCPNCGAKMETETLD